MNVYSIEAIDRLEIREMVRMAIEAACEGTGGIYLSLDLVVVDPTFAERTPVMAGSPTTRRTWPWN